ncbi:MAG TPA: histidine phosphatase family protein [Acidimicrobiaceae bacterium]|nr:histidine phosphatase family protein [Acidimicrobiaceae bacterium]HCB37667.1 histidine phosphatase family protein [Acidimicrobiaceae bacterium]
MELILVRHAQPVADVRSDGSPADPPLSDVGRRQAELAAQWLCETEPHHVCSSPMRRAVQTAEPIAAAAGIAADAVEVCDDISEFDRHDPAYVPMEVMKLTDRARWDQLAAGTFTTDVAEAAAWMEVVVAAFERIVADHGGERVVAVCHSGVVNAYLAHCLGFEADRFLRFDVDYTSVSRVFASGRGHRSVASVNERTHLRGRPDLAVGL